MDTPQLASPSQEEIHSAKLTLRDAMEDYRLKAGDGALTMVLVEALAAAQLRSTVGRAEYGGDDFKIVITTKKKKR